MVHQPWDQGGGHTAAPCRAICPSWASATAFAGFLASFRSIVVRGALGTVQFAKLILVLALGAALAKEPTGRFCVLACIAQRAGYCIDTLRKPALWACFALRLARGLCMLPWTTLSALCLCLELECRRGSLVGVGLVQKAACCALCASHPITSGIHPFEATSTAVVQIDVSSMCIIHIATALPT
jgi:hypothetical protein